ncbi:hypothetical protein HY643_03000 [Candidatus Woesearchaeota archaeon]|nr:hypothetical protein [Candidatus Woesearchaeota archaeon]
MTKLNKSRIKWLVRQVAKEGRKPSEVAPVYKIGVRRVQQLVKQFKDSGTIPELRKERRPKTFLTTKQEEAIEKAYSETFLTPKCYTMSSKSGAAIRQKTKFTLS